MSVLSDELIRCNEIRVSRSQAARSAVMATVLQAQLLFWCWAAGWLIGPSPLRLTEITAGALFTFAVGALVSWPFTRRRIEDGVKWTVKLKEGPKRRRLAFFDDYVTIDEEIVLRRLVRNVDNDDELLRLAYAAVFDGIEVVRLFEGASELRAKVRDELWFDREASGT